MFFNFQRNHRILIKVIYSNCCYRCKINIYHIGRYDHFNTCGYIFIFKTDFINWGHVLILYNFNSKNFYLKNKQI